MYKLWDPAAKGGQVLFLVRTKTRVTQLSLERKCHPPPFPPHFLLDGLGQDTKANEIAILLQTHEGIWLLSMLGKARVVDVILSLHFRRAL